MKIMLIKEAAEYLRISDYALREMADSGKVPGAKIGPGNGRQWVFTEESLDEYIRAEIARQTSDKRTGGTVAAVQPNTRRKAATPPRLYLEEVRK